ncbi:aldehyde dehydrogenase family protein [Streptomyces tricolor]|nr:aldehyde dehydrogenase family protein [Streptomyces tricolor]
MAGYFNAGQDCTAATRVLVQESIHDEFVAALAKAASETKTGRPDDEDVLFGPLNNPQPAQAGLPASSTACRAHAKVEAGGHQVGDKGYFYAPTVVSGLKRDDEIVQNEVFGPVITVQSFTDEDQAVEYANGRRVPPGLLGVDLGPRPRDAHVQEARLRLRVDRHPASRWSRRCRTAASRVRLRQGPVGVRLRRTTRASST